MSEIVLKVTMQDLIIRLDEQRDVLQLLVPQKAGKVGELRVFYEIADSEISSTENLESHIGETILAFLSATYAAKSFRLDQYRQTGKDFGRFISNEAAELLDGRDADNEFEGAMLRLNQFDETWSPEGVDEIMALLAHAAENGSEKAVQFLRDDWPTRSKILKKRLGRTTSN